MAAKCLPTLKTMSRRTSWTSIIHMLPLRVSNHTQSFSTNHHLLKASWLNLFVSPQFWHVGCCCEIIKSIFQPGGKNNRVLSSCGAWGEILQMLGSKSYSKSSKWWCSCLNAQGCRSWTQIGKTTNKQSNSCACSSPCILSLHLHNCFPSSKPFSVISRQAFSSGYCFYNEPFL